MLKDNEFMNKLKLNENIEYYLGIIILTTDITVELGDFIE